MKKKASTKEDFLNELKSKQRKINRLEKIILKLKENQAEEINNRTKELIYRSETQLKRAELASKSGNWNCTWNFQNYIFLKRRRKNLWS